MVTVLAPQIPTIEESGLPRLRRSVWIEGERKYGAYRGDSLSGCCGLGQADGFWFDSWQLQNWLRKAGYDVPHTGDWNVESLLALMDVAGRWDETFTIEGTEGAQEITVTPGTKVGVTPEITAAAWTEFAETVAAGKARPIDLPAELPAPPVPAEPMPDLVRPVAPVTPEGDSVHALDALIFFKAIGRWIGPLPADPVWNQKLLSLFEAWAAARRQPYEIYPDPNLPVDARPEEYRIISPRGVITRLAAEAELYPLALKQARDEAGVEVVTLPDVAPVRKKPWWIVAAAGGIIGTTVLLLVRGHKRRRR